MEAVTGQKSSLEVLLSGFVEEMQTPLDPRAFLVFVRCAGRILHQAPSVALEQKATPQEELPNSPEDSGRWKDE